MKRSLVFAVLIFVLGSSFNIAAAGNMDPKAEQLLRGMSDLLSNAKAFSFSTSETHDRHKKSGKTGQVEFSRQVVLQRPDGLWMQATGAQGKPGIRLV